VIELPAKIAPWRRTLTELAPDLATALAPLVDRLALALGPLSSSNRTGVGDPDGYYGLARRGSYERLLATEWLLAQELPDEFLRRAGAGEHLFLQLAARTPVGGRRSLALFDAGPMQLGAPRVAHLAALIVLFHRAEQARTPFAWGILQRPDATLVDGVSESTILQLLRARTCDAATEEHLAHWLGSLAATPRDEIWIVGDGSLQSESASHLIVREPLEVDCRRLQVSVLRRDGRASAVSLDLPADDASARLLRDPFSIISAQPQPSSILGSLPTSNPVFGQTGRRIMVRLRDGGLASFPIPNSSHTTPPTPVVFRPDAGEEIIAAGSAGSRTTVVTLNASERTIRLAMLGKRGGISSEKLFSISADEELPKAGPQLGQCIRSGGALLGMDFVLCTDSDGRLFHLSGEEPVWGPRVDALVMDGDKPTYVVTNERSCQLRQWEDGRFQRVATFQYDHVEPGSGSIYLDRLRDRTLLALSRGNHWDSVVGLRREKSWSHVDLYPSGHHRVLGITGGVAECALVLLEEDRCRISTVGRRSARVNAQSNAEILHATVSSYGPEVAYVTVDGELVVYSLRSWAPLLRFFPDGLS
jgi:hypothetical protein